MSSLPPLGDYGAVPPLNLAGLSVEEIEAALPEPTPEQLIQWQQALSSIRANTASNLAARAQVSLVLANVAAIARSIGLVLTVT